MGVFDALGCLFGGCASSSPTQVLNVLNMFSAKLNVACSAGSYTQMSTSCDAVVSHCSNLTVTCENSAVVHSNCDIGSMMTAAADTLLQQFSPAQLSRVLKLPPKNAGRVDITNAISANITANCSESADVAANISQSIVCTDSYNIVVDVIASLDLQTGCGASIISGIAQDAIATSSSSGSNVAMRSLSIAVVSIVLAVYAIFLVLVIKKIRATGRKL